VYAGGCPPREEQVVEALCRACGADAARVLEVRDRAREALWRESEDALDS